ncbi:MAG: homoserine kinase, partial [Chloroflexi bacterium]|nr:homoserine kinase [Chloroflexota bacterium]
MPEPRDDLTRALRVRVPASSANLGPGFDSFGLALPLLVDFDLKRARSWSVVSDDPNVPPGADNLFVVAARAAARAARRTLPPFTVTQRSAIPTGRGLGSSAAAVVGGVVAANALLGEPFDRGGLLRVAADIEGHPDNAAAALYGGVTVAFAGENGPIAARIPFPSGWRACVFVPDQLLLTSQARAVLPAQVSRADAIFNLGHASALTVALMRGDGALLAEAMQDRLHEPARLRLVPVLTEMVRAARAAGAFGAALSGAGPTVLAL